jgi:CRP-like cAMP-binding protein
MPDQPMMRLVRKLEADNMTLPEDEKEDLLRLPLTVRNVAPDKDVVREGDKPSQCCLLLDGFQCRYKMLPDGERQILSFHIPGDMPDLQSLFLQTMDHSLGTLSPCRIGLIQHEALRDLMRRHPGLGEKLWRESLVDASIFREWISNVGSRDAYSRIGHLICELFTRLRAVGLAKGKSFECPITQTEIADATGLSTVHVNRSIQQMRADGLIVWERGICTIPDFATLQEAAMFEPGYLHMRESALAGDEHA